ncbi:Poly [ADP-ribose] polymerase tankyrase (Poly ADP-ribose metabolism enzyme 5) (Protein poly-ADP-ribosyltransferase tankyrase) [Durusdinium trenchii]|uniref:Poly [ADP-ribose] polymerase n=1 Tax=Durusdinium trenchii TaxID=1381693 RepID=A0ABP0JWB6_9DINO
MCSFHHPAVRRAQRLKGDEALDALGESAESIAFAMADAWERSARGRRCGSGSSARGAGGGEVNEVFLFHGTTESAAEKIKTHDFRTSCPSRRTAPVSPARAKRRKRVDRINLAGSNAGTLYGRGIYLAENATKSDEYTHPGPNGVRHLLLCRVTLGRVFYSNTKDGTRDGPVLHLVFKLRVQGVTGVTAGRCRRCM